MRALFGALTTRGKWFVGAGIAAAALGLLIPEPDLLRIGLLLVILPLFSAFGAGRARFRLSCSRRSDPARVQAGQPAELTIKLSNVSRLRTGLLLAEDSLPHAFGDKPRFVLDGVRAGSSRSLRYQVRSFERGKYTLGPLQVRVADSFGLVAITRAFTSTNALTVTPRIIPLTRPSLGGNWLGDSELGRRSIAASGEDDTAPREYQTGDGLHRVHWRSTARHGELMVRREEQHWRNTASLLLDTRRGAYATTETFELAVSAAASIGVHLSGEGVDARLLTDSGEIPRQGTFRDTLLDTLAIIKPSRGTALSAAVEALSASGGQIVAVLGRLTPADARQLAAARRGTAPAMALVLAADADTRLLTTAGWRVATARDDGSLAAAWQELHQDGVPTGYGQASYGSTAYRPTSYGAASYGATSDGSTSYGLASDGLTSDGPTATVTATHGPAVASDGKLQAHDCRGDRDHPHLGRAVPGLHRQPLVLGGGGVDGDRRPGRDAHQAPPAAAGDLPGWRRARPGALPERGLRGQVVAGVGDPHPHVTAPLVGPRRDRLQRISQVRAARA
jgi:uncharacterized protein (DUF58 family)